MIDKSVKLSCLDCNSQDGTVKKRGSVTKRSKIVKK